MVNSAESALEFGPVYPLALANALEKRIDAFDSPHLQELITEAVAYIRPMEPVLTP